jgi:ketosteroid isomerase-like protein
MPQFERGLGMAARVKRALVDAFYEALQLAMQRRSAEALAALLAEDVDFMIIGPVELLPYCGPRHGRAAAAAAYREIGEMLEVTTYQRDYALVDRDCAASFIRLVATQRGSRRVISYRIAHFLRFRDGKVVEFRCLIDSLDAAEQVLGRPLDLSAPEAMPRAGLHDLALLHA